MAVDDDTRASHYETLFLLLVLHASTNCRSVGGDLPMAAVQELGLGS